MKKIVLLCLVLVLGFQTQVMAHSTKGRLKVPLDKDVLTIDDIAYFFESFVHREFYKGKYEKPDKRFYVNEFLGVDQEAGKAVVRFRTLDMSKGLKPKEIKQGRGTFEDQATIIRLLSGVWAIEAPGGELVQMYTYVPKWGYYYGKYVMPISVAGIVLGVGILVLLRFKNRNTAGGRNPGGNTMEPPAV
ncbi:MAG: hypothetical protein MI799_21250 [Desulfobacterales bacterium]|nr:hypothetical protein [Desulfobacterales bacterium]